MWSVSAEPAGVGEANQTSRAMSSEADPAVAAAALTVAVVATLVLVIAGCASRKKAKKFDHKCEW